MAKKKGKAKKLAGKKTAARKTPERSEPQTDAEKKLLDALDKSAASGGFWSPKVIGDTIIGEVLTMKREKGKYQKKGEKQLVLTLGTSDGAKTVFCNRPLEMALDGLKPKLAVGQIIGVQLKDFVSTGKGNPAKVFSVKRLDTKKGRK